MKLLWKLTVGAAWVATLLVTALIRFSNRKRKGTQ